MGEGAYNQDFVVYKLRQWQLMSLFRLIDLQDNVSEI